ncbi:MAG: hypothetical protein JWR15_2124, partial [Prosthecobacter sp.]|nr:hypothetical protein [Prosthecobacter sp.]
ENLTPMPVSEAALKMEQKRIQELLNPKPKAAKKSAWQHQEMRRFKAEEAHQGVAVDDAHFYAITNAAIGKYRKDNGERVGGWKEAKQGHIKHLNAGVVLDGKLYCAHSNFPEVPMKSSVEIWDPQTMQHLESIDVSTAGGSLTWVDRREGMWYACFAQYAKTGDPAKTRIVMFDAQWKMLGELGFPAEAVAKFGKNSSSGGSFGPDGNLFITGHDAQELYRLDLPAKGDVLLWQGEMPISAHGQAFAWDCAEPGVFYSIDRKTSEVIVSRITRS